MWIDFCTISDGRLLSMLITELLDITFSDNFVSAALLKRKNCFVIPLLLLRKILNKLSMVFYYSQVLFSEIKFSLAKNYHQPNKWDQLTDECP